MEDLNIKEIQPYLFLLFGLFIILLAIFKKSNKAKLKSTGERAEGIIFEQGGDSNGNSSFYGTYNINDKITIRFLTKENLWITGDINQEFASFYTNQYKDGETVVVYYDPKQPLNFFVDTKQSEVKARVFMVSIGAILICAGLYQLFY